MSKVPLTKNSALRICILTRADLFPTNHGAAVKIVQTAVWLSRITQEPSFVITDDRDYYYRVEQGRFSKIAYPPRFRAAQEWGLWRLCERLAPKLCEWIGYPQEEYFLYRPQFEPAWVMRALAVGEKEKIDVFQAEFPGYGIPAALAAFILRMRRQATGGRQPISSIVQHNVEWDRLEEFGHAITRIRQLEVQALKAVDEVIAVSEDDRKRMIKAGVDGEKITVIPHGVDVQSFTTAQPVDVRSQYAIAPEAPILFFHGTLHYWPNTEAVRFIAEKLLPLLLEAYPLLRIVICGMNPPLYYSHPAIIFTGSVDDLPAYIAAADICICPIFSGGGTRLKLLEYMAARKPIVSTAKGAEGIVHGDAIRIAESAEDMADAIQELIVDQTYRQQLAAKGWRLVQSLDWQQVSQCYVELYQGIGQANDWSRELQKVALQDSVESIPNQPLPRSKEQTLLFLINRGCNLRCTFCDLWQDADNIPLDKALEILDDAVFIGTKILVITGGEPMMHPDFFTLVKAAKQRGLQVNVTTNGTLVEKYWDEVVSCGVDSLSFSLDGLAESHDLIRGRKGAWKQTTKALQRVKAETAIDCSVYFVATNKNVHELINVYTWAKNYGAHFDFWPVNDAPDLYMTGPKEQAAWRSAVKYIAAREPEMAKRIAFYNDSLAYHSGALQGQPMRCLGFVDQYGITYDGGLLPCCVWGGEGLRVGSVFESPLRELWYSPKVQNYRKNLYSKGCTAGCFNHSLYEFAATTGESFRLSREPLI